MLPGYLADWLHFLLEEHTSLRCLSGISGVAPLDSIVLPTPNPVVFSMPSIG